MLKNHYVHPKCSLVRQICELACVRVKVSMQLVDILHIHMLPFLYYILLNHYLLPWEFFPLAFSAFICLHFEFEYVCYFIEHAQLWLPRV